jgi:hypothetical protein
MILELSCVKMGLYFAVLAVVNFLGGLLVPNRREICAEALGISMCFMFIFFILDAILYIFDSSISFVW